MNRRLRQWAGSAAGILALAASASAAPLQDPTRPTQTALFQAASAHRAQADKLILNSTLIASDRRVAVINGTHVSEGESIDGMRILEIRKNTVLIQAPGRQITLQLIPDTLKTRP